MSSGLMPYLGEFLGTAMLILLGDGVVANVTLNRSGMKGAGSLQITIGWGLAVLLPLFIFGASSGGHFNPAVTIALAIIEEFPWRMVPGYLVSQFSGAFIGACLVFVLFKDQYKETSDPKVMRGTFCTNPAIRDDKRNLLCEIVGTFILVFAILGINQVKETMLVGLNCFLVFAIIVSIGISFGGLTGYAINPARDTAPRLAYSVLPVPGKEDSDWGYAWIPVVGPFIGGTVAAIVYKILPWCQFHP